jgi:hypothetical protein
LVVDTLCRGVPRLLRDRLEIWTSGRSGREFAHILSDPEAVSAFWTLGGADFDDQYRGRATGRWRGSVARRAASTEKMADRIAV